MTGQPIYPIPRPPAAGVQVQVSQLLGAAAPAGAAPAIIPLETAAGVSSATLDLTAPWVLPDVVMATMAAV